ncbi:hypothetical protein BJ742DRAFT_845485 [Cladochytrium replicatum]|nr:hypothetical protein BJ742DRAFT_845485 [Cladochytrium replicatum]
MRTSFLVSCVFAALALSTHAAPVKTRQQLEKREPGPAVKDEIREPGKEFTPCELFGENCLSKLEKRADVGTEAREPGDPWDDCQLYGENCPAKMEKRADHEPDS